MSLLVQQALFTTTASLQYLVTLIERNLSEAKPVEGVAQTLLDFSEAHPAFDQLRYLNNDGFEVVRIDAGETGSAIVASSDLQDKSSRSYFQRAVALPRGKVIVFPVEFNKERGVLERPLDPVIRVAMPVFAQGEEKLGVAIINYKATVLLESLFAAGKVARGNPNILSVQGRWLMETQGFQPASYEMNPIDDMSFTERYANEWQLMSQSTMGVFRTENGLYSYRVLLPSQLGESSSVSPVSWTVPKGGSVGVVGLFCPTSPESR